MIGRVLIALCLLWPGLAWAQAPRPLMLDEVLRSSAAFAPQIVEALARERADGFRRDDGRSRAARPRNLDAIGEEVDRDAARIAAMAARMSPSRRSSSARRCASPWSIPVAT